MDICPNCKRKLLSHCSTRCNWCGAEIADEGYQKQAAEERAQFRAHEAERDAIESARASAMVPNVVTGWGRPLQAFGALGNSWQRRRQMEAEMRARNRAMEEYAARGQNQNGVVVEPPSPYAQTSQPQPSPYAQTNQQPMADVAGQAREEQEQPPSAEADVQSMFRHLEL